MPLNFAAPESFAALKEFLDEANYTEEATCKRLGIEGLHELPAGKHPETRGQAADQFDVLVRLFMLGRYVEHSRIRALLPAAVHASAEQLGLLIRDDADPARCYSPASLYPAAGLHLVSDRWNNPDGSPFTAPEDVVYPAITKNTKVFLEMLPSTPCERFLDLCSGTGVAALRTVASGNAREAWATDIADRSTRYAEFNRRLNGLTGVTTLTGNVYEPVGDLTFDRIVAHPPYVPALETKWVFRDAGQEGEQITRRVVAGLPRHLQPGGRLYCLALGLERDSESFEQRVREWLGARQAEFDVLLIELETYSPERLASLPVLSGQRTLKEYRQWRTLFEKAGAKEFFYGFIIIQRHSAPRPAFTMRRTAGRHTGSPETEWLLEWETASAKPEFIPTLLDARPVATTRFELVVSHRVQDGTLAPAGFGLKTDHPFDLECTIQAWTAQLISCCDGTMTGRELYEYCLTNNLIRSEITVEDFAGLLRSLVAGGFVEIAGFTPPAAGE